MNFAAKAAKTRDIRGKLILLGTGTSAGVPAIGCGCPVCVSKDPHNKRMRCSVIWGLPDGNLLVDTPPDMRSQLLREEIGIVHAVAYTHQHADHLYGLDDLRIFQFYLGHGVPLYCEEIVEKQIRQAFGYAFSDVVPTHIGATPALEIERIGLLPFSVLGAQVTPLRLKHGPRFNVLGFRIGNIAYCTDTNEIPPESLELLEGLDVLILDALRPSPHPTHFSLDEAVAMAEKIGAKQTYFTHISCRMDHQETNAKLPTHIQLAYDQQEIPLS